MINLIVAYNQLKVIGKNNQIPWRCPEDMSRFKLLTTDNVVIMGRKTWESLPKRPLPNRINCVLSKTQNFDDPEKGVITYTSLEEAVSSWSTTDKEIFIIGGSEVYKEALESDIVDRMYVTKILDDSPGDAYFPDAPRNSKWLLEEYFMFGDHHHWVSRRIRE